MKHVVALIVILAGILPLSAQQAGGQFVAASRRALPSVIYISVFDNPENMQKTGYGSGTIVSDDGYVVTNYHVVKEGRFYLAMLHDGSEYRFARFSDGRYYLHDEGTDLAVLKLESRGARFTPVTFGDSSRLQEGEAVIAVGNPYGLRHSVTSGIVSSLGRNDVGFAEIEDFIQTDVPINPGNSGGPLVNLNGEMVGVNTAIRTVSGGFQGISFAIPSDMVRKVYSELVAYGRVRRGWLGLLVKEEAAGGERRQVRVVSVVQNSPALRAGIQPGDIILEADGEPMYSKGRLLSIVKNKPVGSVLLLALSRGGRVFAARMDIREKDSSGPVNPSLKNLFDLYGIELAINAAGGELMIARVLPYFAGTHDNVLRAGDLVVEINGERVRSLDDAAAIFRRDRYYLHTMSVVRQSRVFQVRFQNR